MPRGVYERKPKKAFKLIVSMNDEVFKCETDDIKSALEQLKPEKIKTRTIIKVVNQFSSREKIMNVHEAKRLFRNPLSMSVFARDMLATLKTA